MQSFKQFYLFKPRSVRLSAYNQNASNINHQHTPRTGESAADYTNKQILSAIISLRTFLNKNHESGSIIVGCEDYFNSLSDLNCFDLETTYKLLAIEFKKLSCAYPKVIICPGSMYISTPIPKEHENIKFIQEGYSHEMKLTQCYVSNIMPVYYGGELVRIIRKGELIVLKQPSLKAKTKLELRKIQSIDELNHINRESSDPVKITVTSYHEDALDSDFHDLTNSKKGACYLGKTLLPNEGAFIKKYLGKEPSDFPELFNHELTLNNEKLLFVICGEYLTKLGSTQTLLTSTTKYDYVIHSSDGVTLIKSNLLKDVTSYIHSDKGALTETKTKQPMKREIDHHDTEAYITKFTY